jgi:G3E family GTPase
VRTVVVVDVCAPEQLHQALDHLFGAMVLASDALVLNRADRCSSESIGSLLEQVRRLNPAIITVPLASADDACGADVSALIDILSL